MSLIEVAFGLMNQYCLAPQNCWDVLQNCYHQVFGLMNLFQVVFGLMTRYSLASRSCCDVLQNCCHHNVSDCSTALGMMTQHCAPSRQRTSDQQHHDNIHRRRSQQDPTHDRRHVRISCNKQCNGEQAGLTVDSETKIAYASWRPLGKHLVTIQAYGRLRNQ